jgi:NAD(P)H-nitrite reductase large subunit
MNQENSTICRCEAVVESAVRDAIAEGNVTVNDIKRRTRAGMGICQGAYCNSAVARLLLDSGLSATSLAPMTARPPMRLVPLQTASTSVTGEGA